MTLAEVRSRTERIREFSALPFLLVAGVIALVSTPIADQVSSIQRNVPTYVRDANRSLADAQTWLNNNGIHVRFVDQGRTAVQTIGDRLTQGSGSIVTMASGRALAGAANGAHYSATKGGIIALTKSLALDWAAHGIRVNCVIPGISDTAQPRAEMSDKQLHAAGARIPLGRIGQPEDIAGVVAFLLGSDAAYMTGQSVAVNGGAIMIP